MVQILDSFTREEWEMHLVDDVAMPKFDKLLKFLNTFTPKTQSATPSSKPTFKSKNSEVTHAHMASTEPADKTKRNKSRTCLYC